MKNITFAFLAFGLVAALMSAGGTANNTPYRYAFTQATLTNTDKDTLDVPEPFMSNFQVQAELRTSQTSGTSATKLYVDEANLTTGTINWRLIDSSVTSGVTLKVIRMPVTYGIKYRYRINSTGTQVTVYNLNIVAKPLNK